ncbi:MAG: 50S ribosomal protein L3 [Phycisphaerae bacterium]|nr:50S ribosomal protein L3 [Phycisphaerae bacterium]
MLAALLGKKIGMTQVYDDDGTLHPVTVVQAGPCAVLQVKDVDTDGYTAVQIGYEDVKPHRATRPQIGHAGVAETAPKKFVREFRVDELPEDAGVGTELTVDVFEDVQYVDVVGISKGKGFAGVMKRYNFGGQGASHGVERKHRSGGSISGHATNLGTGPKIKKGKRMAGHMGSVRVTSRKHALVGVDKENGLLLVKGPIPGANGSYVTICKSKTAKVKA